MTSRVHYEDGVVFAQPVPQFDEDAARRLARDLKACLAEHRLDAVPHVVDLQISKSISAGARKVMSEVTKWPEFTRIAIVGGSVYARTVTNFIFRMSGQSAKLRFFADRDAALAWVKHAS